MLREIPTEEELAAIEDDELINEIMLGMQLQREMERQQAVQEVDIDMEAPDLPSASLSTSPSSPNPIAAGVEEGEELALPPSGRRWHYVLEPMPAPGFQEPKLDLCNSRTRSGAN